MLTHYALQGQVENGQQPRAHESHREVGAPPHCHSRGENTIHIA